ncbi:MFS transporter [Streptomyces brasiliscabiei]|uniref:MFS transporter n=1 Tax=Streptomyces brasiliscabiei TaxID=2736302 RepID=UPI001C105A50|nr:MFS transporter [Streptomyces brasiliscabiei]
MVTPFLVAPVDDPRDGVTPMRRLAPALMMSEFAFTIALATPVQLLLALHLDALASTGAATAFGVVTGSGALVAILTGPVAGRISDRTCTRLGRRRPWMLIGSLLGALALAAVPFTTEIWQVVLLWCGVQMACTFQRAASSALLADQVVRRRTGRVTGLLGLAAASGPLVGLAVADVAPGGRAGQWLAVAVFALGATWTAFLLLREPRTDSPTLPLNLRTVVTSFWLDPRRHPAFAWAWLVRFLVTCAYASSAYSTFFLMERFGIKAEELGRVVLLLGLLTISCVAVSCVAAGYLSDWVRRQKPFVAFSGVLAAAALVLMAWAQDMAWIYVGVAVMGISMGTFLSVDLAVCVRVLPHRADSAKDLGIFNVANSLPDSLVPLAAPVMLMIGGYTALFGTLAAFGLLGVLACSRLPEVGREDERGRWVVPLTRG